MAALPFSVPSAVVQEMRARVRPLACVCARARVCVILCCWNRARFVRPSPRVHVCQMQLLPTYVGGCTGEEGGREVGLKLNLERVCVCVFFVSCDCVSPDFLATPCAIVCV